MRAFLELPESAYTGKTLIIDIDGTLVPDRGSTLPEEVLNKLSALTKTTTVYLCSNTLPRRTEEFARLSGTLPLGLRHKKPSRRVVEEVAELSGAVVIGDKAITDGLFAVNIGAEFVMVKRLTGVRSLTGALSYGVDAFFAPVFHLFWPILPYLSLMRPTQWAKNALVFAPLAFAGEAFHLLPFGQSLIAFLVFSCTASALYVLNDIADRTQDTLHPTKRFRPLALGQVPLSHAYVLSGVLLLVAGLLSLIVPALIPAIATYAVLNIAYSLWLKHVPVIDLLSVSSSYVLRVLGGGLAASIYVSPWIMLCIFFGAFVLITGKRRAEYVRTSRRAVLKHYSKQVLDVLLIVAALFAMLSYVLYAALANPKLLVGISAVFVVIAIGRLLFRVWHGDDAEYPEVLTLKDPWIIACSVCWALSMFGAVYVA